MKKLTGSYEENIRIISDILRVDKNYDIIRKRLSVGKNGDELTFFYVDGFVKDTVMQKLMLSFTTLDGLTETEKGKNDPNTAVMEFVGSRVAYVEADITDSVDEMLKMVLSGATLMLGSAFGEYGVIIDTRTYPARETAEPQTDRVMRGSRDGFVETLVSNTALIRRRIRDTTLTMEYLCIGKGSKTDAVLCYMSDRADPDYVDRMRKKLLAIDTDSLNMGHQSLAECLISTRWYNPFPKIRSTERPDVAAAQLYEGSVLILLDNSPEAMVLPTSVFDFMQETNDYYFPPLTGTYVRVVRHLIFALTLFAVPVWYFLVTHPDLVPGWLRFMLPEERGNLPIIAQILLVEFIVDGLKMASMNTPDMLSNSLSVVGGLILGDFAVSIGWLIPEVILLMAFVAIANFSQRSYELGYAFKFLRVIMLILTGIFGGPGLLGGIVLTVILLLTNKTVNGDFSYLYPIVPFDPKAFLAVFFRVKKKDVKTGKNNK